MPDRILHFALLGSDYPGQQAATVSALLGLLRRHGARVSIDRAYSDVLSASGGVDLRGVSVFEADGFEADFAVSLGGDGTFLKVASRVGSRGTPIVGVNMGRLGFLADVLPSEAAAAFESLFAGDYQVERHVALQLEGGISGSPFALNDIAILKRDSASMIGIRACVNGEHLATYQADGLILSTPTGSTAYSLSNGGPVIAPLTGVICLTPVAPHSLNVRPIVLGDDVEIRLTVESRSHSFLVAVDGRSEKVGEQTEIVVRRAPFTVNMVKFPNQSYFATLRTKMMWGADGRN